MRPLSHPSIGKVGSAHSTCTIWWCSLRASCMGDVRAAHARSLRVRTCSPAMWGSLGLIPVAGERRSVVVVAVHVGRCNHTTRRFRCEGEATRCPVEGTSVCSLAADRCAGVDSLQSSSSPPTVMSLCGRLWPMGGAPCCAPAALGVIMVSGWLAAGGVQCGCNHRR